MLGRLIDQWRKHRYQTYLEKAHTHAGDYEFDKAANLMKKARKADPQDPYAAYKHGQYLLEAGQPNKTLQQIDTIHDNDIVYDPQDLFELETEAALRANQPDRARRALNDLADHSLDITASFVHDLNLDDDTLGPHLTHRLNLHQLDKNKPYV